MMPPYTRSTSYYHRYNVTEGMPMGVEYLVQAKRDKKQHGLNWVTDSRHPTPELAGSAAEALHELTGRVIRVVDSENWKPIKHVPERSKKGGGGHHAP